MAQEVGPGQIVAGRYKLVASLGSGGFGRVWKAWDKSLQVDVAIKEIWLPPAQFGEEHAERLQRAAREARNAAKLRDHPNIVTVYEVVVDLDRPWIAMQLVDGCSLEERIRERGALSNARVVKIARTLLKALDAAHRAGLVHRDVKPANVMIAKDGKILLTDFGIARHRDDTVLTATGSVIGSPEYMAPERIRGRSDLTASDLFSLGATLFQAVEGVSPFRRDSSMSSMSAVLMDEPPETEKAEEPLDGLLEALLEKDPEDRPTVPEALAMLAEPSSRRRTEEKPAGPPVPAPKSGSGSREVVGGVVIAVILAIGVLFYNTAIPKISDTTACEWMQAAVGEHMPFTATYFPTDRVIAQANDALDLPALGSEVNRVIREYRDLLKGTQGFPLRSGDPRWTQLADAKRTLLATCKNR